MDRLQFVNIYQNCIKICAHLRRNTTFLYDNSATSIEKKYTLVKSWLSASRADLTLKKYLNENFELLKTKK